jgi:predicted ribosome-associated RNA-binding protein Tma20
VIAHPKLPDTVVIGSLDKANLRPQEKEVIVDATCGAAVLRGAHVFAPGVMGMPTGASTFFLLIFSKS